MRLISLAAVAWMALSAQAASGDVSHGVAKPAKRVQPACSRVIAKDLGDDDYRIVGLVAQSQGPRVLIMDRTNKGIIVRMGECLGRKRLPFDQLKQRATQELHPHQPIKPVAR